MVGTLQGGGDSSHSTFQKSTRQLYLYTSVARDVKAGVPMFGHKLRIIATKTMLNAVGSVKPRLHDITCCQTGCTTGCIV